MLVQVPTQTCGASVFGSCILTVDTEPGAYDPPGWNTMLYVDDNGDLGGAGVTTTTAYNDNQWHYAVVTYANDGTDTLYVDGENAGSTQQQIPVGYSPSYSYFVGTSYTLLNLLGNWDWLYFNGTLDQVSVSNTARSGDWIKTEYNNQGSPSTFYSLNPVGSIQVIPSQVTLYPSQSQQLAATGICSANVLWTLSNGSQGTLSSSGFYTAPESVTTPQTVTVTATNQTTAATLGSAVVSLLPVPPPVTLAASSASPYIVGSSHSFVASLRDEDGSPEPGVAVSFAVAGANSSFGTSTSDSSGNATFTYVGATTGMDTVQATASINGEAFTSNSVSASWVAQTPSNPGSAVTLVTQPILGLGGLMGAFTASDGTVIEPIAIGSAAKTFVVPTGATQLLLGVDDNYFEDNGGSGFVVQVNGTSVTVPSTAMPWNWVRGGLNNSYQFGNNDGTSPIIGVQSLTQGSTVRIAYQGGTVSTSYPARPLTNANGDPSSPTGVSVSQGTYYPSLYTTPSSYPVGQPLPVTAIVTDSTGTPASGVSVTLTDSGANPGQFQATSDSTGNAALIETGSYTGNDALQAEAFPSGSSSLISNQAPVTWVNYPTPPTAGTLTLSLFAVVNNVQVYTVLATDSSGAPVPNISVGFYVSGADSLQMSQITDITGHASFSYYHINSGAYSVVAVETVNRNVVFSNTVTGQWTPPSSTTTGTGNQVNVSISAQSTVTLPAALQLNGTVTDNVGITPTVAWTQISGPGTVTFADPQQAVTTASFSESGNYVLQLTGSDSGASASAQFTVKVYPVRAS